jgi:hypothetical protein
MRACTTRSRTASLDSPGGASGRSSAGGNRGTSMCRSQQQRPVGVPAQPQGQKGVAFLPYERVRLHLRL